MAVTAAGIEVTVVGMDDISDPPAPRVVERFTVRRRDR
jgi:hypothetical protein